MKRPDISPQDIAQLNESEAFLQMQKSKPFNQVLVMLEMLVASALITLENEQNPQMDSYRKIVWAERKRTRDAIVSYVDQVIAKRRDAIVELLRDYGVPDDLIERNMDMSFESLLTKMGGPINGTQQNLR